MLPKTKLSTLGERNYILLILREKQVGQIGLMSFRRGILSDLHEPLFTVSLPNRDIDQIARVGLAMRENVILTCLILEAIVDGAIFCCDYITYIVNCRVIVVDLPDLQ